MEKESIMEFFIKIIGLRSLIRFLKNPIVTYIPCSKSTLKTKVKGEHVNINIEIEFKGDSKADLDDRMSEDNFLSSKQFSFLGSDEMEELFKDYPEALTGLESLCRKWSGFMEQRLERQTKEEEKKAAQAAKSVEPKKLDIVPKEKECTESDREDPRKSL